MTTEDAAAQIPRSTTSPQFSIGSRFASARWSDGFASSFLLQDLLGNDPTGPVFFDVFKDNRAVPGRFTKLPSQPAVTPSGLAIVGWNSGSNAKAFYQSSTKALHQLTLENGKWSDLNPNITAGLQNTGIAAVQWGNGGNIRVYYQNSDKKLCEYCYDGNWFKGRVGSDEFVPASEVAAVQWDDGKQIRVYYFQYGKLMQLVYDTKWSDPEILLEGPFSNFGLAASMNKTSSGAVQINLYYVESTGPNTTKLVDYCYDGKAWNPGTLQVAKVSTSTWLAAAAWNGNANRQVTFLQVDGSIVTSTYENGKWGKPKTLGQG